VSFKGILSTLGREKWWEMRNFTPSGKCRQQTTKRLLPLEIEANNREGKRKKGAFGKIKRRPSTDRKNLED